MIKESFEIQYRGKTLEGIKIKEDDNTLTLKLPSGYNAVLEKKNIKKMISKGKTELQKRKISAKISKDKSLPRITILHTGGTIASKVDYETGAVTSRFTPEELLGMYPELNEIADLRPKMISNLSSEDMRFKHYNLLLEAIEKEVKGGVDGIIITHGTDTMHYTSAALQYSLSGLPIPILLVGAQRSSDRPSSDAYSNLKAAIGFIASQKDQFLSYRRVGICMHSDISRDNFLILDGLNTKKMHSSRRDAFKQINFMPFAKIENGNLKVLRSDLQSEKPTSKIEIIRYDEKLKIGFFKAHPNLFEEEISSLSIYDAVVIEGTGLGHLAVSQFDEFTKENPKNLEAVKNLIKKTKLIVGVQTVYGGTNMNIYSSGRYLKETGVLGDHMNLTTETLFIRAAYILSFARKDFEKVWMKNLEGFESRNVDDYDKE